MRLQYILEDYYINISTGSLVLSFHVEEPKIEKLPSEILPFFSYNGH